MDFDHESLLLFLFVKGFRFSSGAPMVFYWFRKRIISSNNNTPNISKHRRHLGPQYGSLSGRADLPYLTISGIMDVDFALLAYRHSRWLVKACLVGWPVCCPRKPRPGEGGHHASR
jgi:hypothetical protein